MELSEILGRIDELKRKIDQLRPLDALQKERIMQKFRLDWNYHSNAIEGNSLSLSETRILLLHGITAKQKPLKDYLDIQGHDKAIRLVEEIVREQRPLTEADIRGMHEILLGQSNDSSVTKNPIKLGEYKSKPNFVYTKTGEKLMFASPEETPPKMGDLMAWYRGRIREGDIHPLILATTFHHRFVEIHPFDDGNGRMARLLMNLILMRYGFPPVIIPIESRDIEYYPALATADTGDLEPLTKLIGRELIHSLELYLRGARGENINDLGDLDKRLELLKLNIESEKAAISQRKIDERDKKRQFALNYIIPFFDRLAGEILKFTTLDVKVSVSEWGRPDLLLSIPTKIEKRQESLNSLFDTSVTVDQIPILYVINNNLLSLEVNVLFRFLQDENKVRLSYRVSSISDDHNVLELLEYDVTYHDENALPFMIEIVNVVYKEIERILIKEIKNE